MIIIIVTAVETSNLTIFLLIGIDLSLITDNWMSGVVKPSLYSSIFLLPEVMRGSQGIKSPDPASQVQAGEPTISDSLLRLLWPSR
jgi:hypothetical protein